MTIKQYGGVFGRNPTFNDVTIEGQLTFDGDIDVNSDLTVDGGLTVTGSTNFLGINNSFTSAGSANIYITGGDGNSKNIFFRKATGSTQQAKIQTIGDDLRFFTGSSEAARFNSSGNLAFPSGQGIDFSATGTGTGTSTSELLADYEEGTFVPVGFGITYSTASGVYTKIGNTVIWSAIVTFPTTADTNVARVTLPFAVAAGNENRGNCSIGYQDGPVTNLTALHSAGTSYLSFYVGGSAQTNANLSANTIFLGGSYQV